MKWVMIFLVLSMVVFMAEPGESFFFGTIKSIYKGAKAGWRAYKEKKLLKKSQRPAMEQGSNDNSNEAAPPYN